MCFNFLLFEMKTKFLVVAVAFSALGLTGCKSNEKKSDSEEASFESTIELSELINEETEVSNKELAFSYVVTAIDSPDVEIEIPEEEEEYEEEEEEEE